MTDQLKAKAEAYAKEYYYGVIPPMQKIKNAYIAGYQARDAEASPEITGETSDGYHTFNELYEFRKMYNAALFNEWYAAGKYSVHKSLKHCDGELCFGGGWFIVVANLPTGQITNHYKVADWDLFKVQETEKAIFEYDGHTGLDTIERLWLLTTTEIPRPEASMKWVKEVDRVPENTNLVHLNFHTDKTNFKTTGFYEDGKWFSQNGNPIVFSPNLKWLDESGQDAKEREGKYWNGFDYALSLIDEMFGKDHPHPYNIADCVKAKVNRLPKEEIRHSEHSAKEREIGDDWICVSTDPPQYSTIEAKTKEGHIIRGGYYQENNKICCELFGQTNCIDLEENFTHWRHISDNTIKQI